MKPHEPFVQHPRRNNKSAAPAAQRITVQMGSTGAEAVAAVQAIAELCRRQKIGRRLGAAAVIKAERS
jgi:homoserine kinase